MPAKSALSAVFNRADALFVALQRIVAARSLVQKSAAATAIPAIAVPAVQSIASAEHRALIRRLQLAIQSSNERLARCNLRLREGYDALDTSDSRLNEGTPTPPPSVETIN